MLRRQLSSSVFALAPFLEETLSKNILNMSDAEGDIEDFDENEGEDNISNILDNFKNEIAQISHLANSLSAKDLKIEEFIKVIEEKEKLDNNKFLVFSTFKHTLTYLHSVLVQKNKRVGLITGEVKDYERLDLRNRFALEKDDPKAIDILLSSEVGCEGLDYQFCDALINFDIPWNPMKLDQRIGRIDRYGQKSKQIVIYNFITPGTIDSEIFTRCHERIGIFQDSIGGNEEILGSISKEIKDIALDFALTEEEKKTKLKQLVDNKIRMKDEYEKLENDQSKFFGLGIPTTFNKEDVEKSQLWIQPYFLKNLVKNYFNTMLHSSNNSLSQDKKIYKVDLNSEERKLLLDDLQTKRKNRNELLDWENLLKSNDSLTMTFDQETANNRRDIKNILLTQPILL